MRKTLAALLGMLFPLTLGLAAHVTVKEVQMDIPTYVTGPDDPAPPFGEPRVYPYPMQTAITRDMVVKTYRVVVLENEYIRVLVLPDVGGRILGAEDKTNKDFDFIYHNHVIKPGLVALRGAWLSGGIEWNFPTLGHTVNTVSPVKYKVLEDAKDGTATVVVGTEEWVRRMKWEVFITLYPGRSAFTTRIRLENLTLTHANGYFWANAATHDWDDTRVIFPPTDYTYAGGRANPTPWPILDGRDVSWVKNTANPYDYFCGTPGDFNAAYNYDHDNGTAHWADRTESPGKKFWTWGTAPSGKIWEDILTDKDGQYIEVQSGRLLTQGDSWIFDPLLEEEWSEWWYPLKGMHGMVKATPDAAVNFEVRDKGVFVALNVTSEVKDARLTLARDGQTVFTDKVDLTPAGSYAKELPLDRRDGVFTLALVDGHGRTMIDYSTAKAAIPAPELQPVITEAEATTAQARYLQGYYALKHWDTEGALGHFRQALALDPDFVPALRWLGILYSRTGQAREALPLLDRALGRDEDDYLARYYRALTKMRLGIDARTEDDLALVERRAETRPAAAYALAAFQARHNDYARALETLQYAVSRSSRVQVMLAALGRRLGFAEQASRVLANVLYFDPLDSLAIIESLLRSGEGELSLLRNDPEYFLEAASVYADFGFYDDASRVIEIYLGGPTPRRDPRLYYDWGYYLAKRGLADDAKKRFAQAAASSLDYVFPFRTEDEEVFRAALANDPADWKARYLLGCLLTAELRPEEGLAEFNKAAETNPPFAMLYRNIGELLRRIPGRLDAAVKMFERAVALDRSDFRLMGVLDGLYEEAGDEPARDRLFRQAPAAVQANFNIVLRRAQYFVETGDAAQSLRLLTTHTFLPWEGWTSAHEVYVSAHLKQALTEMARKDYGAAIAGLKAAKDYPKNLGTGRPASPITSAEDYYLGLCYRAEGNAAEAAKSFASVVEAGSAGGPEPAYFQALALKETGREADGRALLEKMKADAEETLSKPEGRSAAVLYQAALASRGLGDATQASEYFREAVRLQPSLRWTSVLAQEWTGTKK